ncbi:unnamed protein product [Orchesella dallaii]|uniref:Uncharacterized protein n=1 Tax=Orchesella dallaii TaxID=48710 RepID=A0ABP1R4F9_9HEXA
MSCCIDVEVNYTMLVVPVTNFRVGADQNITALTALSSPSYFLFEIPSTWQFVFIHATSKTNTCAAVGVRKLQGLFLDQMGDQTTLQLHETFTLNAGITVSVKSKIHFHIENSLVELLNFNCFIFNPFQVDLFRDGFLLVSYPLHNSEKCIRSEEDTTNSLTNFDRPKQGISVPSSKRVASI